MKIPTSSATIVSTRGNARSGAKVLARRIVPTPSSSGAAARNARLNSSSVRSDGLDAMGASIAKTKERRGKPRRSRAASGPEAYRQTGAPSGSVVAAGATGVTAPTYVAQLLDVFRFLIATIHPPCVPVPAVELACTVFPVVTHNETVPATAGL